jgi:uncharacterized protein YgbK (DUF1537 family)
MTNKQIDKYKTSGAPFYQLDPMVLINEGADATLLWLREQNFAEAPLIYATAQPDSVRKVQKKLGVETAGKLIEDVLAACAVAARESGVRRFVVAGGETSGAVTKALEVTHLEISDEITPGVPWTFCQSDGHDMALALKSGNFGNETFFKDALTKLNV